jgi:hypothetical protein
MARCPIPEVIAGLVPVNASRCYVLAIELAERKISAWLSLERV